MNFWHDQTKSTEEIAQDLLGCLIIKNTEEGSCSGWIVETEAYLGEVDEAAHSYALKKTPRLESMYKQAGTIYIYSMHTHQMLNLTVQETGVPHAILIRAIEPYIGIEVPNKQREMVRLIELLNTEKFKDPKAQISMAMGKDIGGNPIITDLARAPHMLVAGTTGSNRCW